MKKTLTILLLVLGLTGCTTAQVAKFESNVHTVAGDVGNVTTAGIAIAPDVVTVLTDVGTGAAVVSTATAPKPLTGNTTP